MQSYNDAFESFRFKRKVNSVKLLHINGIIRSIGKIQSLSYRSLSIIYTYIYIYRFKYLLSFLLFAS